MCGIIAVLAERNVTDILLAGLYRLEYRGYDSAGLAVLTARQRLRCIKRTGKVANLERALEKKTLTGQIGIAHTRWATHGAVTTENAHPHHSNDSISVVHNGIIENDAVLRKELIAAHYQFASDTDSEVIGHLIHYYLRQQSESGTDTNLFTAVNQCIERLKGAYAFVVISTKHPRQIIGVRKGSPLVLGNGINELYLASDVQALRQVTDRFTYLEEDDVIHIKGDAYTITNPHEQDLQRPVVHISTDDGASGKGNFRHYMVKEIFEQPSAIRATLQKRISDRQLSLPTPDNALNDLLEQVRHIHIVSCGTSYHAGLVARHWLEELSDYPCTVEIASEYRYRPYSLQEGTLLLLVSQSGETADTLACLRDSKKKDYLSRIVVCNVAESSMAREADILLLTNAGPEFGVASTKAFTSQLIVLLLLVVNLVRNQHFPAKKERALIKDLQRLPQLLERILQLDETIQNMAHGLRDTNNALFVGRGMYYPIALEGALKMKEISYIHAEAFPAGELKHGPLALVEPTMPVIALMPNNRLRDKMRSNLREIMARGGHLYIFSDRKSKISGDNICELVLPTTHEILLPILYTIPLQLLAYHVAVLKGTDIDQPRNLAKSVTVE